MMPVVINHVVCELNQQRARREAAADAVARAAAGGRRRGVRGRILRVGVTAETVATRMRMPAEDVWRALRF